MDAAPASDSANWSPALMTLGWLLAIAIRLAFLTTVTENFDLRAARHVSGIPELRAGLYNYDSYNYAPLWAVVLVFIGRTAARSGWPFAASVCGFLNFVDIAIALLVWKIARDRGKATTAPALALLAFANPLSVIVSSHLGQFDNLAIAFLLAALACSAGGTSANFRVSVLMGFSLIAKHVTWFHPLLLFRGAPHRRAWITALPYALFLISFSPFWHAWRPIRDHVLRYRSGAESFGLEPLREVAWLPKETATLVFVAVMLASAWLLRRVDLVRASLLLFLVQLVLMPGIWPYYFVWPVALGAIFPSLGYLVYTLVVTAFFFKSPDVLGLDWPHLPGWWGCWWAAVFWLLWELRGLGARKSRIEPA